MRILLFGLSALLYLLGTFLPQRNRAAISSSVVAGWLLHAAALSTGGRSDGAPGLFVVDGKAAIVRRRYFTIDGRSAADLSFEATPARAIRLDAADLLEAARYTALACLAVEAAALMRRLVSDTAAYVRQREQFGKPLFTFQVVQHRVVDMEIEVRRTGAIARRAIAALEEPPAVRLKLASAAKVTASRGGRFVGQQAVQLHGAMGMTQELAIGRLFKRLTVIENELCSVDEALRRFAAGS